MVVAPQRVQPGLAPRGGARSSALSCSPRAISAGSVRSRTARSAMRASSWWRTSWSGSPAHLGEEALHAVEELLEQAVVDGLGHPPRRLLGQLLAQQVAVLVEQARQPVQGGVEQRLVVPAGHRGLDHPGHQRRGGRPADPVEDPGLQGALDVLVAHDLGEAADHRAGVRRQPVRVLRLGPATRPAGGPRRRPAAVRRAPSGARKFVWTNVPRPRPSWSLRLGMIAVCGIGRPSGCRKSAVTANQSASAPTMAASAVART